MSIEEHKNKIVANLNQAAVNTLVDSMAVLAAENDDLKAKLAELQKPKPVDVAPSD